MNVVVRGFLVVLLLSCGFSARRRRFDGRTQASTIVRGLRQTRARCGAAGPGFDVDRATEAYLDLLSPEQRELSNAYFEGGYWLQLWEFLYGLGVAALLLYSGLSRRMRDIGRRFSRRPWLQTLDLRDCSGCSPMFLLLLPIDDLHRIRARASVRPRDADVRPRGSAIAEKPHGRR